MTYMIPRGETNLYDAKIIHIDLISIGREVYLFAHMYRIRLTSPPRGGGSPHIEGRKHTFHEESIPPHTGRKSSFVTLSVSRIPRGQKRSYRERTCALGKSVLVTYVR